MFTSGPLDDLKTYKRLKKASVLRSKLVDTYTDVGVDMKNKIPSEAMRSAIDMITNHVAKVCQITQRLRELHQYQKRYGYFTNRENVEFKIEYDNLKLTKTATKSTLFDHVERLYNNPLPGDYNNVRWADVKNWIKIGNSDFAYVATEMISLCKDFMKLRLAVRDHIGLAKGESLPADFGKAYANKHASTLIMSVPTGILTRYETEYKSGMTGLTEDVQVSMSRSGYTRSEFGLNQFVMTESGYKIAKYISSLWGKLDAAKRGQVNQLLLPYMLKIVQNRGFEGSGIYINAYTAELGICQNPPAKKARFLSSYFRGEEKKA